MKIILFALDTLRYDHLGCYGHPMDTTPCIDALAKEGVVFDRHYSTDVPTPPGYTAMMTGCRGQQTGIFGFGGTNFGFDRSKSMLAESFSKAGYRTGMISNLLYVCPWLVKGFHDITPPGLRFQGGEAFGVTEEACRWLDQHHKKNFFLFVHYWDPHTNYFQRSPDEYKERYLKKDYSKLAPPREYFKRDPLVEGVYMQYAKRAYLGKTNPAEIMPVYDACIRYMDDGISKLIDYLKELEIDEETLLLFTSDHGEAFGERGFYDHMSCYENISHVPMIVRWPKGIEGGKRAGGYSMGIDLMPTLLDLSGLPVPEGLCGRSLKDTLLDGKPTPHAEVVTDCASIPIQRMYIHDDWALVHTIDKAVYKYIKTYELFNLKEDKEQEHDLSETEVEKFHEMRTAYDAWLDRELRGHPDKLQGITFRGGGWGLGMMYSAFHENPSLYFSDEAIRERIIGSQGPAARVYHEKYGTKDRK